jgi:7-keto-8-aminopelargonate synthetase-like enzyme
MLEPEPLQQIQRTYVRFKGRKFSYFAGCDYFRLASHPAVVRAFQEGARRHGLNVAASRLTTGNHRAYQQLEQTLTAFFEAPAALLVSNGYAANAIVAQAMQNDFSLAVIDARAHSSLRDASRFLRCPVHAFRHRDPEALARVLAKGGRNKKTILLTDGVFAHDGEIAPLGRYLEVLTPGAVILLDDAHAAGVAGRTGRGTAEFLKVVSPRIIQTISLSKAFGVFGGAILGTGALRQKIVASSPMFAGSTPLPLPLAIAARRAIEILKSQPGLRRRLEDNVRYVKSILRNRGFPVADTPAPIIGVTPANQRQAGLIRDRLISRKIFPSFIKYPGGPAGGYFRLVISSEHTGIQLDALLEALDDPNFRPPERQVHQRHRPSDATHRNPGA